MPSYRFLFRIGPPGFFGLPDSDKVVVPAKPEGRQVVGPVLDTRTGQLVSHGTLSEFRPPDQALKTSLTSQELSLSFNDNFLEVIANAENVQLAADRALSYVDLLTQALTSMYGGLFSASLLSAEDSNGVPQPVQAGPKAIQLFQAIFFNIDELRERVATAALWATVADAAAKKALFYFEHACLVKEFSDTLPPTSHHSAFSMALAFLQLFKALTAIIGDPSSDRDYQSRFRRLGLARDFWEAKVRPLYDVRNEEDVAHYSHEFPDPHAFRAKYVEAISVFREAFMAYMTTLEAPMANTSE